MNKKNVSIDSEEKVKIFLQQNAIPIIVGLVIGIGGIFGWNFYTQQTVEKNLVARETYLQIVSGANDLTIGNHKEYNNQSLMVKAKNNLSDENTALELINAIESDSIINDIKNIKLATIYFNQKKYDKALSLLENSPLKTTSLNIIGDIYLAQEQISTAREYYEQAFNNASNQNIKNILAIKIANLR